MEKFIENLKMNIDAFEDVTLDSSTDFKSLEGWDSLALLSTMALFASEYGKKITASEINSCTTVGELFEKTK